MYCEQRGGEVPKDEFRPQEFSGSHRWAARCTLEATRAWELVFQMRHSVNICQHLNLSTSVNMLKISMGCSKHFKSTEQDSWDSDNLHRSTESPKYLAVTQLKKCSSPHRSFLSFLSFLVLLRFATLCYASYLGIHFDAEVLRVLHASVASASQRKQRFLHDAMICDA